MYMGLKLQKQKKKKNKSELRRKIQSTQNTFIQWANILSFLNQV